MEDDCLFCSIIEGEQDADQVYETDEVLGFHDINPQAPTHLLFVPKKHIASVNDLRESDESLIGKLYTAARSVAEDKGFAESGYRLVVNCGDDAMQSVDHLHLHCLAERQLDWPPG
ncbi:MAG: histidine triad nucleotide-binding protein [bacterium]